MPGYRGHLIAWGVVAIILLSIISMLGLFQPILLVGILIGFLITILPDIDSNQSKIHQLVSRVIITLMLFSVVGVFLVGDYVVGITFAAFSILVFIKFIKHRGVLHNPIAALIIPTPLLWVHIVVYVVGVFAYATHIYVDLISTAIKRRT